jgi:uncharacterized protein YdeI (YjbR/CyaY-like superfamily)
VVGKRPLEDAEQVEIASRGELRAWLRRNHRRTSGVWLVLYKKAVAAKHVAAREVTAECLCFGWVDSLTRAKDEQRSMLYIAPRKPTSNWSRVNKRLIAELEREGLLAAAGRRAVEIAKANGSWSALDEVEELIVPDDLECALAAAPGTRAVWDAWPRSVRRGVLELLLSAKREETRRSRIAEIVRAGRAGERPFQWRKRTRG